MNMLKRKMDEDIEINMNESLKKKRDEELRINNNLEEVIGDIDIDMMRVNYDIEDNIKDTNDFNKRLNETEADIQRLNNLVKSFGGGDYNEISKTTRMMIERNMNELNNKITKFSGALSQSKQNIDKLEKRLNELKSIRAFAKLTNLESFTSRNPTSISRAFGIPGIVGNIAQYGGKKSKKSKMRRRKTIKNKN